jgi:hypothetical protein
VYTYLACVSCVYIISLENGEKYVLVHSEFVNSNVLGDVTYAILVIYVRRKNFNPLYREHTRFTRRQYRTDYHIGNSFTYAIGVSSYSGCYSTIVYP